MVPLRRSTSRVSNHHIRPIEWELYTVNRRTCVTTLNKSSAPDNYFLGGVPVLPYFSNWQYRAIIVLVWQYRYSWIYTRMLTCHGIRCMKAIIISLILCGIAHNYFKEYTLIYCSRKNFEEYTFWKHCICKLFYNIIYT